MSDTTQYPNGIYEFTGTDPRGHDHWHNVVRVQSGWLEIMGDDWTCRVEDCKVRYLTPLVPSTELDAARQRIADLEAEVERLRAEQWTPVADGEYPCQCDPGCPSLLQIASDADSDTMAVWMRDEEQIGLVHLHGLRLCKRGDA